MAAAVVIFSERAEIRGVHPQCDRGLEYLCGQLVGMFSKEWNWANVGNHHVVIDTMSFVCFSQAAFHNLEVRLGKKQLIYVGRS